MWCSVGFRLRSKSLELLGLTIIIIHDSKCLFITGLLYVLAHFRPVESKHFGVGVTAGQELEGHPAKSDLWLLKETFTPWGEFIELGENQAGFPVGKRKMKDSNDEKINKWHLRTQELVKILLWRVIVELRKKLYSISPGCFRTFLRNRVTQMCYQLAYRKCGGLWGLLAVKLLNEDWKSWWHELHLTVCSFSVTLRFCCCLQWHHRTVEPETNSSTTAAFAKSAHRERCAVTHTFQLWPKVHSDYENFWARDDDK